MNITLKKIDENNFIDAFNLKLLPEQEEFVSHPIRSLAQAYVYYTQCTPLGIYNGDTMVGYVMVIYDYDEDAYNIWHMMIDAPQQHKGYGRASFNAVLDYIKGKPFGDSDTVLLTCSPKNKAAYSLYESLGFTKTDRGDDEEDELMLIIGSSPRL